MEKNQKKVLVINGGSSSIKFAVYDVVRSEPMVEIKGSIDRIGDYNSHLKIKNAEGETIFEEKINRKNFVQSTQKILNLLKEFVSIKNIVAIGHRIVFGGFHHEPKKVDSNLIKELKSWKDNDEDHLPAAIKIIEILQKQFPSLPQIASFDTSFHSNLPKLAQIYALPIEYYKEGIRRYGFHGISYTYLLDKLSVLDHSIARSGKIIMAHLGNGASIAAIKDGKCLDTSMGFTPTAGLTMGKRCGDIDPGILLNFIKKGRLSPRKIKNLINHESGLLGVSGISSDMRELIKQETKSEKAKDAIQLFCYNLSKYIGSYTAVLEGLDTIVFSGGIGENAPEIRKRICEKLGFLGVALDYKKNEKNDTIISNAKGRIKVMVIPTDEEIVLARNTIKFLNIKKN